MAYMPPDSSNIFIHLQRLTAEEKAVAAAKESVYAKSVKALVSCRRKFRKYNRELDGKMRTQLFQSKKAKAERLAACKKLRGGRKACQSFTNSIAVSSKDYATLEGKRINKKLCASYPKGNKACKTLCDSCVKEYPAPTTV